MSEDIEERGAPCGWCGDPVRQSGVGRRRAYCSRTCRELAYRGRKREREIAEAVAAALAAVEPAVSTTVVRDAAPIPSVVETEKVEVRRLPDASQWRGPRKPSPSRWSPPPVKARPADPPASPPAGPAAPGRVVRPTTPAGRRPRLPPAPGVRRVEPTLFDEE